jgi:hypothetical protein
VPAFRTRGDANLTSDSYPVVPDAVRGRVRWGIGGLGTVVSALTSPWGSALLIGLPAGTLIGTELYDYRRRRRAATGPTPTDSTNSAATLLLPIDSAPTVPLRFDSAPTMPLPTIPDPAAARVQHPTAAEHGGSQKPAGTTSQASPGAPPRSPGTTYQTSPRTYPRSPETYPRPPETYPSSPETYPRYPGNT